MDLNTNRPQDARPTLTNLVASCAVLALAIAPAAVLVAALSNRGLSTPALLSAGIGGGICWLAAALALTATFFGNRFHSPVQGLLVGMLFRMGLPLAAIVAIPQLGGPLAAGGITTTILGVYLVALVIETLLAVRLTASDAAAKAA